MKYYYANDSGLNHLQNNTSLSRDFLFSEKAGSQKLAAMVRSKSMHMKFKLIKLFPTMFTQILKTLFRVKVAVGRIRSPGIDRVETTTERHRKLYCNH